MSTSGRLMWDKTGERFFETGVSHGVLYTYNSTTHNWEGVVWNGLTAVNESAEGGEATAQYADDIKYLNLLSNEDFKATIEAFTYPDEFAACDGSAEYVAGVRLGQQPRKPFCFAYVTRVGNDEQGADYGTKIHLVYNALAAPSDRSYGTMNDSTEPITFSWEVSTTPIEFPGFKPTAHIVIDTKTITTEQLKDLEDMMYGTDAVEADVENNIEAQAATIARMPMPSDLATIFTAA